MNHEHLTDDQIQGILDAQKPGAGPFLPWQLRACPSCRARFEGFQRLYTALAADPGFDLPPGFADSMLERIPATRPSLFRDPVVRAALACAAGALALLGLVIFVDLSPLASGAARTVDTLGRAMQPLPGQFRSLFSWLDGGARLLIYGGLGLLGASLLDRFLRRRFLRHAT